MSLAVRSCVCRGVQSTGLQLGGPALVPDMMYRILDIFNPSNARLLAASAAGATPCVLPHTTPHVAPQVLPLMHPPPDVTPLM